MFYKFTSMPETNGYEWTEVIALAWNAPRNSRLDRDVKTVVMDVEKRDLKVISQPSSPKGLYFLSLTRMLTIYSTRFQNASVLFSVGFFFLFSLFLYFGHLLATTVANLSVRTTRNQFVR